MQRFEVLAVEISAVWDVIQQCSVNSYQCSEGSRYLHPQRYSVTSQETEFSTPTMSLYADHFFVYAWSHNCIPAYTLDTAHVPIRHKHMCIKRQTCILGVANLCVGSTDLLFPMYWTKRWTRPQILRNWTKRWGHSIHL